jgi:hypothetical protein
MSYANTTTYGNITINAPIGISPLPIGAITVPMTVTAASGSNSTLNWATGSNGTYSYSNDMVVGKTRVTDNDILFGNVSLKATLQKFEERLAILVPNPAIEAEFEELKQLREKYVKLEKKLAEQKAAWDVLKK